MMRWKATASRSWSAPATAPTVPTTRAPRGIRDPLAVRGIEGDRHIGEDRAGKLATELRDQNGLQKRSFIDTLPTVRIGRPVDDGRFRLGPQQCKRRGRTGRRRRGLRCRGQFPLVEFVEQLEKLPGRGNGLLGCDAGGWWNSLGEGYGRECGRTGRKRCPSRCCGATADRFRVPIGQHKRFGAQGTPAALHFLKPQCFQQYGLGFGAWGVAGEWDGLIVGK